MNDIYYLPINSSSLAHYFSKACICPSRYYNNRPSDFQNKNKDGLIISTKMYSENTDCSLEIVFTEDEINNFKRLSSNCYAFNKPLPITRVKKIYFKSDEQKKVTFWNINEGAAFAPEWLATINNNSDFLNDKFDSISEFNQTNLTIEINKYDKFLGGLALMRLGGEDYMNYSENYFSTLSYFNSLILEELKNQNQKFNDKFIGAFTGEKQWNKLHSFLFEKITNEHVENFAKGENINIQKKFGGIDINSINRNSSTYSLAILSIYGEGKSKKIDDFIADIFNEKIEKKKIEVLTLLFGINNGYASFRNKYKIHNTDKIVKFELNSQLDYYTIESIYQFIFNNKKENKYYPFLDWCVKQKYENKKGTYKILDKIIVPKKKYKVGSPAYLEDFFANISNAEIYDYISNLLISWFPPFINIDRVMSNKHFEKELKGTLELSYKKIIEKICKDFEDEKSDEFQANNKANEITNNENEISRRLDAKNNECYDLKEQIKSLQIELNKVTSQKKEYSPKNLKKDKKEVAEPRTKYSSKKKSQILLPLDDTIKLNFDNK